MRQTGYHIIPSFKKQLVKITGLLLVCLLGNIFLLNAQPAASKEYKIKAVFLYNFTQFVEWPAAAFASPGAPFVIGILGDDPFGSAIDETVLNEKINGHPLQVQRYHDPKDIKNCHILFINDADPEKVREKLSLYTNHNTLTVSDAGNFMKAGGIIRFITENNKIRLQVNPDAARAAELIISSKLLRVSDIYDSKSQPK